MATDLKLEVYSPELELQGLLQVCRSIIWIEEAFGAGSFQLESILNDEATELLKSENIIWIADDTAGIIENFELKNDDSGLTITVKGRLLTSILDRRVLWGTYNMYGKPAVLMAYLVDECCVTPTRGTVENRVIDIVTIGDTPTTSSAIRVQSTGGNLLDVVSNIGNDNLVSFKLAFNPETNKAVFTTRYGVNRTTDQSDNDPVFYSTTLDDVLSSDYIYDSSNYKNAAYIGGQINEEDQSRVYAAVEGEESGLDRRELFVDARDLSDVVYEEGVQTYLTDTGYQEVLINRGKDKLGECQISKTFEVSVRVLDPTYEYGADFYLGDTITLIDESLGITVDAVVTAVQRSITDQGEEMVFTFGYSQPTIYEKLRRR